MSTPSAVAAHYDAATGVITASVTLAVPPARVFTALTTGTEVMRWWGSRETYVLESWTAELRVGGTRTTQGRRADGQAFGLTGTILVYEPPWRLVKTWRPCQDPQGAETTLTYQLTAIPKGTLLSVRHEGFHGRSAVAGATTSGWTQVLTWLQGAFTPPA